MEGSMMNMDAMVATPANAGLLPGWSAQMQGMMTLLRVLPQPDVRPHDASRFVTTKVTKWNMPGMNMKGGSR